MNLHVVFIFALATNLHEVISILAFSTDISFEFIY